MHLMKTQYLYIFTAVKCGSTCRFGIIFDSHALNSLLALHKNLWDKLDVFLSSVSATEIHTLTWCVCQVLQTNGNQPVLI